MLEKLGYGAIVMLLGMAIVFIALVLLIVCIWLMGRLFAALTGKKKAAAQDKAAQAPQAVSIPLTAAPKVTTAAQNEDELTAVIAAAVASILSAESQNGETPRFVVRRITRVGATAPAWRAVSRADAEL